MKAAIIFFLLSAAFCIAQPQPPRGTLRGATEEKGPPKEESTTLQAVPAAVRQAPTAQPRQPTVPVTSAPEGAELHWLGHSFVMISSRSGIKLAVNPFSDGAAGMSWPGRLTADIVLISSEAPEVNGGQNVSGNPQIFRSIAGVGANRANGIPFRGISTYGDARGGQDQGSNTAFVFEVDHVRFCHPGTLGHVLSARQAEQFGRVDVLILPIGDQRLTNAEIMQNVAALNPKIIIPVAYQTPANKQTRLRTLREFDFGDINTQTVNADQITFHPRFFPRQPTVLLLSHP